MSRDSTVLRYPWTQCQRRHHTVLQTLTLHTLYFLSLRSAYRLQGQCSHHISCLQSITGKAGWSAEQGGSREGEGCGGIWTWREKAVSSPPFSGASAFSEVVNYNTPASAPGNSGAGQFQSLHLKHSFLQGL